MGSPGKLTTANYVRCGSESDGYKRREELADAGVEQGIRKVFQLHAVERAGAHIECRRRLRVAHDLRTCDLHRLRNVSEAGGVGHLDFVEGQAERMRCQRDLARAVAIFCRSRVE